MDWLQRGLADMLITSMSRVGPYQVIQRHQLRELLREHRLSTSVTAVQRARLARADLLLLGNFALDGGELSVELRLLRVDSQRVIAGCVWKSDPGRVLEAPAELVRELLSEQNVPIDSELFVGLEQSLPRTVDRAAAFYEGERAADVGDRTRALAHYLDAARGVADYLPPHRAVLRTYRQLRLEEHAVEYAAELGRRLERAGDIQHALELYYFVAESFLETFESPESSVRWLERIVEIARRHETGIPPAERTTARVKTRALELRGESRFSGGKGSAILDQPEIRFRIWTTELERQLARRERLREKGGFWRRKGARWIQEEVPDPTVFMWKIRSLHQLASVERRLGRLRKALTRYREILVDYEEIAGLPIWRPGETFYWGQGARSQLRQVLFDQQKKSGGFIRDPEILGLARFQLLGDRSRLRRNFEELAVDPRAGERYDQVESFHFLARAGLQIDSVSFEAKVNQLAGFHFGSRNRKRARKLLLKGGVHREEIRFPPGTEYLSLRSSWGGILLLNHPELSPPLFSLPSSGPAIAWWEVKFHLSPRAGSPVVRADPAALAEADRRKARAADAKRVARFVHREGWERGAVDRAARPRDDLLRTPLDGRALEWRVTAVDGDLQLAGRGDPENSLLLPRPIRSEESERAPALVKSHEGGFALFWSRGPEKRPDRFYVASSRDLVSWSEPRELALADPEETDSASGRNTGTRIRGNDVRAKTGEVFTTRTSYVMVLDRGLVRHSDDLVHWSAPVRVVPADARETRFVQTLDRRVWAVYCEASANEELYTHRDVMLGYYVRGGRKYKKLFDVAATSSADGITWTRPTKIFTHGEPSEFWAFPLTERAVALAVLYNGRFLRWAVSTTRDRFQPVDAPIKQLSRRGARFFVHRNEVICSHDVRSRQDPTRTLTLRSKKLHEALTKPLR